MCKFPLEEGQLAKKFVEIVFAFATMKKRESIGFVLKSKSFHIPNSLSQKEEYLFASFLVSFLHSCFLPESRETSYIDLFYNVIGIPGAHISFFNRLLGVTSVDYFMPKLIV